MTNKTKRMKVERKKEIGERIKYFRQKQDFTQEEFSKLAGITRIALGNYERGERSPTIEIFERIAKALNITTDELLEHEPEISCCPFCGSSLVEAMAGVYNNEKGCTIEPCYYVTCNSCDACGSNEKTPQAAIKSWNKVRRD